MMNQTKAFSGSSTRSGLFDLLLNGRSAEVVRSWVLHAELDQSVAAAYGWSDLDLGHGFHETKQGERYRISESARRTVLDRLLALNHQRYAEEIKAGLHDKGAKKARAKKPKQVSSSSNNETQSQLL